EGAVVRVGLHCTETPVGRWAVGQGGEGDHGDLGRPGHTAAPFIVQQHDAAAGMLGGEQLCLGGEVVLDAAVEVEVVGGQVGESDHVVGDSADAALGERMGGDLHGQIPYALADHAPQ